MKNANRAMLEETGLVIGDDVSFKGEVWRVDKPVFTPETEVLHCIMLSRTVDGGSYSTAAWATEFNGVERIQ